MSEYRAIRTLVKLAELKKAQAEVSKLEAELAIYIARQNKKGKQTK